MTHRIALNKHNGISYVEDRNGSLWACSYHPARPLPDDAPQAVKDMAAQHWTPEVIQFAKDRLAGVRPKED
jgi:hypothetical protein